MIVNPGQCVVCEKSIASVCPTCGSKRFSELFTEVTVQWSNGSLMPIGICRDCAKDNKWSTPEAKAGIAQAHWDYWDKTGGRYDKAVVLA